MDLSALYKKGKAGDTFPLRAINAAISPNKSKGNATSPTRCKCDHTATAPKKRETAITEKANDPISDTNLPTELPGLKNCENSKHWQILEVLGIMAL
jgi:hypothetical protein